MLQPRFVQSATGIMEKHPTLRISFPNCQGQLFQAEMHHSPTTLAPAGDMYLAKSGYIFDCHMEKGRLATGMYWAEARDAAEQPTTHRATPTARMYPSQVSTV